MLLVCSCCVVFYHTCCVVFCHTCCVVFCHTCCVVFCHTCCVVFLPHLSCCVVFFATLLCGFICCISPSLKCFVMVDHVNSFLQSVQACSCLFLLAAVSGRVVVVLCNILYLLIHLIYADFRYFCRCGSTDFGSKLSVKSATLILAPKTLN